MCKYLKSPHRNLCKEKSCPICEGGNACTQYMYNLDRFGIDRFGIITFKLLLRHQIIAKHFRFVKRNLLIVGDYPRVHEHFTSIFLFEQLLLFVWKLGDCNV